MVWPWARWLFPRGAEEAVSPWDHVGRRWRSWDLASDFRRVWFEILGCSGPLCFTVRPLPLFMRLGWQWAL